MELGVDIDELTRNGSNQPPPVSLFASALSLSMFPDD